MTLDKLSINKKGKIIALKASGDIRRRMLDLGIIVRY